MLSVGRGAVAVPILEALYQHLPSLPHALLLGEALRSTGQHPSSSRAKQLLQDAIRAAPNSKTKSTSPSSPSGAQPTKPVDSDELVGSLSESEWIDMLVARLHLCLGEIDHSLGIDALPWLQRARAHWPAEADRLIATIQIMRADPNATAIVNALHRLEQLLLDQHDDNDVAIMMEQNGNLNQSDVSVQVGAESDLLSQIEASMNDVPDSVYWRMSAHPPSAYTRLTTSLMRARVEPKIGFEQVLMLLSGHLNQTEKFIEFWYGRKPQRQQQRQQQQDSEDLVPTVTDILTEAAVARVMMADAVHQHNGRNLTRALYRFPWLAGARVQWATWDEEGGYLPRAIRLIDEGW